MLNLGRVYNMSEQGGCLDFGEAADERNLKVHNHRKKNPNKGNKLSRITLHSRHSFLVLFHREYITCDQLSVCDHDLYLKRAMHLLLQST